MTKRRATTEFRIAALSAAIELVSNPGYGREWLQEEFVEKKVRTVRVTNDIVDAVEEILTDRLAQFAETLKTELAELLEDDNEPDEPSEDAPSDEPDEFAGGEIVIVDFIELTRNRSAEAPEREAMDTHHRR